MGSLHHIRRFRHNKTFKGLKFLPPACPHFQLEATSTYQNPTTMETLHAPTIQGRPSGTGDNTVLPWGNNTDLHRALVNSRRCEMSELGIKTSSPASRRATQSTRAMQFASTQKHLHEVQLTSKRYSARSTYLSCICNNACVQLLFLQLRVHACIDSKRSRWLVRPGSAIHKLLRHAYMLHVEGMRHINPLRPIPLLLLF